MTNYIKTLSFWINKLPLSGKLGIRPTMFAVYAEKSFKKKLVKSLAAYFILIMFVIGHSIQAKMGYDALQVQRHFLINFFCGMYALVNVLVTFTQVVLTVRLTAHLIRSFSQEALFSHKITLYDFSWGHKLLAASVTIGGQLLFSYCATHIYF